MAADFGFVESPTDPLHLFVLLKDLHSHGSIPQLLGSPHPARAHR